MLSIALFRGNEFSRNFLSYEQKYSRCCSTLFTKPSNAFDGGALYQLCFLTPVWQAKFRSTYRVTEEAVSWCVQANDCCCDWPAVEPNPDHQLLGLAVRYAICVEKLKPTQTFPTLRLCQQKQNPDRAAYLHDVESNFCNVADVTSTVFLRYSGYDHVCVPDCFNLSKIEIRNKVQHVIFFKRPL